MKTQVTLELDSDLLQTARVLAEHEGTSMSAFLSRKLEEELRDRADYQEAKADALKLLQQGFDLRWSRLSSRDELYDR